MKNVTSNEGRGTGKCHMGDGGCPKSAKKKSDVLFEWPQTDNSSSIVVVVVVKTYLHPLRRDVDVGRLCLHHEGLLRRPDLNFEVQRRQLPRGK